jgi:PEGA domain
VIKSVLFFTCLFSSFFLLLLFPRAEVNGNSQDQSGYGLLWIEVSPSGASISLDGKLLDQSVWLISTAPGEHDLSIAKNGFQTISDSFEIKAGQNLKLKFDLVPEKRINEQDQAHLPPSR